MAKYGKLDENFLVQLLEDEEEEEALNMNEITLLLEVHQEIHRHGGSRPGRASNIDRDRLQGQERLMKDYFSPSIVFGARLFRRRFRMHRKLFLCLVDSFERHDKYFQQRPDATVKLGRSALQKATAASAI
ncbi:hypothetical protein PsorP6_018917 [Peronosclerospora sorghi]|nr:hypothetical protein PsorP6_018917 [Peronosclerospora sorghi]